MDDEHSSLPISLTHSPTLSQPSIPEAFQHDHAVQAALFILNGFAAGKDTISRIASCFECSSITKSTFIAEEGLAVCWSFFRHLFYHFLTLVFLPSGDAYICHIWTAQYI
jgi:hypothetical protein